MTRATPLVSILIPAFNAQEHIAATLTSAVNQTWPAHEIIVVDDGSTDRTLAIARRFESTRVKVVAQPHRGAAAARNHALTLSQGAYIQWLDADDLLAADKIARQMEAVERVGDPRVLFSCAWGRFIYRRSHARFVPTSLWQNLGPLDWLLRKMEDDAFMQTGTWLVSRELTSTAGLWDTRMLVDDDGEYFSRVLMKSREIHFVPPARVLYRMSGPNRLSHIGGSVAKMRAQLLSMQLQIGYVRSLEDSPRVKAACVKYLQHSLTQFDSDQPEIVEQVRLMALRLGGQLEVPALPWKYSAIAALFGPRLAGRARVFFPQLRNALLRLWDHALFNIEHRAT